VAQKNVPTLTSCSFHKHGLLIICNSVTRKTRHFHCSYLKAYKVSKSEGTRKVRHGYHFWKCADAADRKLSKLVDACQSYSKPKLACFSETHCSHNNSRTMHRVNGDVAFQILVIRLTIINLSSQCGIDRGVWMGNRTV